MGAPMQGMGIYGLIGVLGIILGLAKEIFIIAILFQGIRLANVFIKKYKNEASLSDNNNETYYLDQDNMESEEDKTGNDDNIEDIE